jgi:hypothetical protein
MSSKKNTYKEELTEKMHSEFSVTKSTDIKHIVFSAIACMRDLDYSIEKVCKIYSITEQDINKHKKEFNSLLSD